MQNPLHIADIYLGLFFTFIALFYSLRLLLSPHPSTLTFIGRVFTSHWWGHISFRIFRLAIWWLCVLRIYYPEIDYLLGVCTYIRTPVSVIFGSILLSGGFLFVVIAHRQMGSSWRSGIDPTAPEGLVTHKLFSKTRNPISMGIITSQIGFFFALPSIFSLVCLLIGVTAIINQIRLEEAYLSDRFDEDYTSYCNSVPRWL